MSKKQKQPSPDPESSPLLDKSQQHNDSFNSTASEQTVCPRSNGKEQEIDFSVPKTKKEEIN